MDKRIAALFFAGLAVSIAACGGGGGGYSPPSNSGGGGGNSATPPPPVQKNTIGIALPSGMGSVTTSFGTVGGYTQQTYSQVMAFPPGTVVTIKNLGVQPHTLNVMSTSSFPSNPALSTSAAGGSSLAMGWQSGSIPAGGTVTVTLATAGTYFIGCAFHYTQYGMRDVLMVSSSATPGPQATPQPSSGGGSGGSGCNGVYC
jgi:plastocyanin